MIKKIFFFTAILTIFFLNPILLQGQGTISGRVTDTGSYGITNVAVFVYELDGTYVTEVYTDSNGDYTSPGIAAGSYKVEFDPWDAGNYISEWYNDKSDIDSADQVTVTDSQTTTLSDAVLATGGIISGRVTDGTNGIFNVMVEVKDLDNIQIKNAWTDASGYYTVDSLPTGNYKIYFDTYSANNYFPEWYNDKSDFSSADQVSVTAGQTTNLADAVLMEGGIISGTVKDSLGSGINNVYVRLYDLSNNHYTMYATDSSGAYSISPIPAGDWKVYFDTSNAGNYLDEWYNDKSDFASADQVSVTAGQTTTLSNAVLTEGGIISGRVTDSLGTGIESVSIFVYDLNENFIINGYTDSSGNYSLEALPAGTYKLEFSPASGNYLDEWYNDKINFDSADQVSVTLGQTTSLADTVLEEGGIISGRVTDSQGTGILDVDIYVWALDGNILGVDFSDSDGYYTVEGIRAGDCKVSFETFGENNYISEFYNDKSDWNSADTVSVSAGQTTTLSDAVLAQGGAISGRVTDSLANGIENIGVYVSDLNHNLLTSGYTDANGDYTVMAVLPGDCKVRFDTYSAGNYLEEWYNDQGSFNDADTVTVTSGSTTTGIDAQLADGGIISGKVMDSSLVGIEFVMVSIYDLNNNRINNVWTDINGDYSVQRLLAGSYKVYFETEYTSNSYLCEWYNDKGDFDSADTVVVTAGSTTNNINASLADGGAISGRVTDSTGTVGIANVDVQVCDLAQYWLYGTSTDSDGYYTINAVPTGSYKVQFNTDSVSGNYVREWYNGKVSFNDADVVNVTNGTVTGGINALLADGGSMSGRVTDSGDNGIANVNVHVHDMNQNNIAWTSTDSNGDYTVRGIPTGNHKVYFWPLNAGNYIEEWYNDQDSFENADTVAITAGNTTTGIDAQLADGGAISGRVTDSTDTVGLASIEVQICDLAGYWYNGTNTDSDGYYTLRGLPTGDYKVEFRSPWGPGNYIGEWYNDKDSFENADTIPVTVGQTTTGIDAQLADGGAVSGRVTDSTGTVGIANVDVQVFDLSGNGYCGVTTDGSGYYTRYGLPTGNYKVKFDTNNAAGNYVDEWYNNKASFESGDTFSVTVGQTTTGIDAQLADGGAISGRVTDIGDNGISGISINIYDMSNNHIAGDSTDSNGDYTVRGIPAGDFKVQFWVGSAGNYISEWYNNQGSFASADAVSVTVGNTTTGIDAQLADSGAISGRVTDSTGTVGIPNVSIQVCDLTNYYLYGSSTDSNGYYTVYGVIGGSYKVEFRTDSTPGNYAGEWYNDRGSFNDADTVIVTVGSTTTGIDAQLADGGSIGGRVTDSLGSGIANVNVNVHVHDMNQNNIAWATTDSNGDYTVKGIPPGNHKVQFWPWNAGNYMEEWYNDRGSFDNADTILVISGETNTGIDAQLADSGAVSGRVTDSSGTVAIAGVEVQICDLNGYWYNGTGTDSNGYYTLSGLPAGDYKVEFRTYGVPGNYVGEWYNNQFSFESANTVSVTIGQTSTGVDVQLADGGAISGRVTDSNGTLGIANVYVQPYDPGGNWYHGVHTDGSGYYTIHGFPAGSYKVQFSTQDVVGNYVDEWYNDKASMDSADAVSVTVGVTTTGIDAQLADGGSISGRVSDESNNGIANVNVNIYDLNNSDNCITSTATDSSGNFTVPGLAGGDYKVQFWPGDAGNYLEEWYNNQGSYNDADLVTVTAGSTTTGIDAQLASGGIITGKVMDSSLMGIENVRVYLYDLNCNWINSWQTDSYGDYTIEGLASGSYKIYFEACDTANSYINEWYNNAGEFDNANEVAVTAGQTTYNINSVLDDGGAVSGRVTNSTGTLGIANVEVQICDLTGYWHPGTNTDNDGYYTLKGLPGGDYKIEFRAHWVPGNYVSEWYNDKDSFENADVVTVTVGQTTTGIDAQLADGGGVSGRVTDSSGTSGIGNVYVNICDLNQNWLHCVGTDNDGYYTISGVPDGSYKIQFDPHDAGNYALEWWNNKRRFEDADTVIVTTGNTVTDIDAQLEEFGSITGTVTDDSSAATIENVRVYVYDLANNEMGNCWTDASGNYTVGNLYPGNFKVFFETSNVPIYVEEWYNDQDSFANADQVLVNEGAATTIDAALTAVQDDSYEPNNDFNNAAEITTGPLNNLVYLSPQGAGEEQDWYKVYLGPEYAGQDLKVNIKVTSPYPQDPPGWWGSDLDFQIYDGAGALLGVVLSSSDDETLYIANLSEGWYYICLNYCTIGYGPGGTGVYADYAMTVEISDSFAIGYISGRVTDEQGQGIGGSLVQLMHSPNNWEVSFANIATDADGYYTAAYDPGDYTVSFNYHTYGLNPPPPNYVSEYYNDQTLQADAQVFTLHVGASITGIDAELVAGATIEGTLTHANGNPIVENYQGQVLVYDQAIGYTVSYDYNDASGYYSVKYLPPGSFKVRFRARDENWQWYAREWYNDQPSLGTGDDVVISTVGEVLTGIDNQFSAGGILQGRVTNAGGGGISNVRVCVYHPSDPDYIMVAGYTDGNGDFYIREVFPGEVRVFFDADDQNTAYLSEWYNDQADFNAADPVSVTAGETVSGLDAQLSDKGSISGRITDSSGTTGIENVDVYINDLNGNGINGTNTDANGDYTINGIPAGDYKVDFNPENASGNYIREWYNDKNSFNNADTVTVTDGQTTANIDAQLADGASIGGRVTDSSGTVGIQDVEVRLHDSVQNYITEAMTDSDGYYTIQGLSAGDYKVEFQTHHVSASYVGEWYNDKSSFNSADTLAVTSGQALTGINAQLADGGAVSGRVTDASGTVGIANVNVFICDPGQNWLPGTNTDNEGYYTLKGLPAGDYKIEFRTNWTPGNYVGEWYNDKGTFESADTVSVTMGQTTSGIDAQLANGGSISGRVTDTSGQGISNVDVQICDLNQYWYNGVSTDENGYYTIYGLAAGNYKIEFDTNNTSGNYSSEWYNDKSSFSTADPVSVSVGFTTPGIDAQLGEGGVISGRVTDSNGTVGIANVEVQVCDLNHQWLNQSANTDSDGYYTINGLSTGDYKVEFRTYYVPGNYVGEWYNDKYSFESADTVSVTIGQTTTGIDAQLAAGGAISGRVTDSTGTNGIANVSVQFYDLNQYWLNAVATDSDGYYTIYGMAAGTYKVQFTTEWASGSYVGEWYNDKGSFSAADPVSVSVGVTTTAIDAQLVAGATVSGRVTDSSGTVGIANVDVQLVDPAYNHWLQGNSTDNDGYYTIKGIAAGDYKIEFRTNNLPGNYAGEWYNDKGTFYSADILSITAGQTVTGIDAQLADGGGISGRVTDSTGTLGIANVDVQIRDLNNYWYNGASTDNDGYYNIYGLPAGDYKIEFSTHNTQGNYTGEWYNNKDSFDNADAVSVTVGQTTTGIDAQLAEGGAISGRVTDSSGTVGIYNVDVQVYDLNNYWINSTSTDSDGYYTMQGLTSGNYKIEFTTNWTPGDYVGEWYNDKGSFENADSISVTVGQTTTGIDAQLADGGSISGRVTDSTGTVGINNVNINIRDMNNNWYHGVNTDNEGYYTMHGLPAGDYTIEFNPNNATGNYVREWYNDKISNDSADPVTVTVGQTTTGIDAQLADAGSISGRVTDSSANGIANVNVRVYDSNNNHINSCNTDSNGDYTIPCLPPGDCKVYYDTWGAGNYIPEWYNDKGAFDEADVVAVTAGQTTVNIDAQLAEGGTISGQVTNESAEGIEAVFVRILYPDGSWAGGENTDSDGNYTVNRLPAGSYKVDFYTGFTSESYVREWYNDKGSFNSADPVDVTAGATTTIDAILETGGTVTGRVTNDSAVGIQNVLVELRDMNYSRKAYAYTDENGDYTVKGFSGGSYKVYFDAYTSSENYIPEWYNDKDSFDNGDTISVNAGQTVTGIDAVLVPGCSISGTVTDASANPIQFIEVYAGDTFGNWISWVETDSSGNYELNGLTPGSYKVLFYSYNLNQHGVDWYGLPRNYNYKYQYYSNKDLFSNADVVAVTLQSPATGIDAVLTEDSGIISGQINDSLGSPIEGALAYVFMEKDNFIDIEASDYTGPDGTYEVKGLPPSNCIVLFLPPGGSSYRRILYDNTLNIDNATEVPVTAGQTTSGINAVLPTGGLITGRVTDESGNPLDNVTLRLLDAATNEYLGFIGQGTSTDVDGYYTLIAQTGQWKLIFQSWSISGNGYVSEFYNDRSTVENADILTVNPEATLADIDAVLSTGGGKISGYVKDPSEAGLYNVSIDVYNAQYETYMGHANTDDNGYFEIPGLIPGNYKIYTTYFNIYPSEWYSDKTAHETADVVTVAEGGNTEVSIILGGNDPGATAVTGRVTNYSGSGIENVNVNIYDLDNNFINSASTDSNGDYAFEGIPAGDYKVYFDTSTAGNWLAEWYENKEAFDEADTITVAPGQALENIDAQLAEGGVISGRAMNEAEVGVEGVQVEVRDLENNVIDTANTDANGDYTIEKLPANSYKVYFDVNNANGYYVGQWYNNRDSFDTANIVVVMAGGTTTVDAILGDGIGISGNVTDNSANPIANIEVDIHDTGGLYITYGYTDGSGNYEVKGLAPGNYKVNFNPIDLNHHGVDWYGLPANTNYKYQWYNNKEYFADADVVTAAPGSAATGINAVMTDGQGGIISGQITDSQANGIAGCFVYALQSFDAQERYYSDYMRTGTDGNFQVKGLPTGDYIVLFLPPGGTFYRRQFYNNTIDQAQAAMVSVIAGQTTSGINAVLQKGGIVTGRVTDSSGNGLENVWIRLMDGTTNKYMGWAGNNTGTDADGYYTMYAQPGQWKVMFQTFAMSGGEYVSEFYNNQTIVENGNIITVAAEEEVANINAVLSPGGGKISGFVKDPGNEGLYNGYIEVWDTQYQVLVGHANADRNGYFEVPGLIPGNYKLYASYNLIYPSEWYSDGTTYAAADELTVIAGGNTQVLIMLGADDPTLPLINVTSPNGGESLTGGTSHDITWDVQGNIEAVLLQYSIDNGANWITIEPFAENTGIYKWTVPETPSDNCLVRIGASDSDAGPVDVSDAVFSIVSTGPASINLKSPNRWVTITAGTTEEITWHWTGSGDVDNIMLEYSIDSGQTWLMIVPGTANTGSYFWYVPDTPSEHCLVRIQVGEGDETLSDISDVEFSIITPAAPVLHVTSPNGGETWKVGYFYNITWDTIGTIENVKLEYSVNGGGSWTDIIASTPNNGSYDWTVPDSPAESCLIRVSDAAGESTDTSNESFAIVPAPTATLDVTSPNGGESLTTGAAHDITWTSTEMENVESVMIEYSVDNGASWTTVVPAAEHNGSGGSYNWTVPDTPSETCLVRITDNSSDEGPSDISDAVFTIEPAPFITVTSPNGGEQWQTGSTYAINWTSSGITGNVVIDLYRGTSFDCNITTTPVDTGSFDWNIPISFTNADDYKVLIYQDTIEDYSDNSFSISDSEPNHPDFNNDGHVDILWRNYATGGNEVWLMNLAVHSGTNSLQAEPGLDWRIVGTGDFNRDGKIDLLWRNYTNGQNMVWYMNGTELTGTANLPVQPDVTWQVAGAGDFNSDGSVDILWRNVSGGRNQVWYLNGITVTGYMGIAELKDTSWRIAGLGDFNDDDKLDILWRNYVTGHNQVWYMDGVTRTGIIDLMAEADLTWQIAGTGDFNQDGKIDILWRRYSDGMNMIWYMDGIIRIGFEYIETRADLAWRISGNGDYKE
jgi:hypothetical protein